MTYSDFAEKFLPQLAELYLNKQLPFHGLVDFDLWKKVFPEGQDLTHPFYWNRIKFNAFPLGDEESSLLLVYSIPMNNTPKEIQFIGIRFDKNRNHLNYYTLRRPRFYDDFWNIFQYNFKTSQEIYLEKLQGTNSIREFCFGIKRIPFKPEETKPSMFDRVFTKVFF